ncbi:hypothetical protein DKX38_027393 [Salix brachista]|uniref:Fe2OG dioxygenase domain-containing protein n=1 Tax=Salix brachista TaxID=2182728 RepID=A0A5N5JH60_9ROSI|nr:hypothetical protein DKX38_027393 [Salix brachista]
MNSFSFNHLSYIFACHFGYGLLNLSSLSLIIVFIFILIRFPMISTVASTEVMVSNASSSFDPEDGSIYDSANDMKAFDETKGGVKGLADSGLIKIPRFFVHPPEKPQQPPSTSSNINLQVPIINFEGFESSRRKDVVNEIRRASENWGLFQVVNHGIPENVMDDMLEGVKRFHEQPQEVKTEFYTRDADQRVKFFTGALLLTKKPAIWRDTVAFDFKDGKLDPQLFPAIMREEVGEYFRHVTKIGKALSELLSEALGLRRNYLSSIECMETESLVGHYYPACPQPELTFGTTTHSDPSFLTILLQDNKGGLQVLHQNQWVDVPPLQGALLVNIGDLMQLITNDRFRSVEHRVLAGEVGPRISLASFFFPSTANTFKPYGVIQELLSDDTPIYRATHLAEFMGQYMSTGSYISTLSHFKVSSGQACSSTEDTD